MEGGERDHCASFVVALKTCKQVLCLHSHSLQIIFLELNLQSRNRLMIGKIHLPLKHRYHSLMVGMAWCLVICKTECTLCATVGSYHLKI